MDEIEVFRKEPSSRGDDDPLDDIHVGDWYWVEESEEGEKTTELYCVESIGSNYVGFTRYSNSKHGGTYHSRIPFDVFEKTCRKEENWSDYFNGQMKSIQAEIQAKTWQLIKEAKRLCLVDTRREKETLLPSVVVDNPIRYKNDLVLFKDETMPKLQEEIEQLAISFSIMAKSLSLADINKLEVAKKMLSKVNDRIFSIELYAGIQETVKKISEGGPAGLDEPIRIFQQMLYMDEETLFDYRSGGMDFEKIHDFDEWAARPENLERILPAPKSIVAFRVRRNHKEYGEARSILDLFIRLEKDFLNLGTYLLIRNGGNVYRIASSIDFSPRLIPFKDEIGEKQFKESRWMGMGREDEVITIGPDNVNYDDHVEKMVELMKKYNRVFLLIQGLLDRTTIFQPHPGIKLNKQEHMDRWLVCVRDEEMGLPNNSVTFEEYRDQLNKTLRPGNWIWSKWVPDDIGYYGRHGMVYTARESQIANRPFECQVESIRRDRSKVTVKWETDVYSWPRINDTITRHLEIPMEEVFNLTGYNQGDFRMFLCDRGLRGKYLKWAPPLLTAENYYGKFRRRRRIEKEELNAV